MTTIPDREIYLAARGGDPLAFRRLVGPSAPAMFNAALWIGGGDERYAARVRRRAVRSFERMVRHTRDEEEALVELFRGFASVVEPRPLRATTTDQLRRSVAALPTRAVLALTLTTVAGLRHSRVADVLGIDVTQVRVVLHEARDAVRHAGLQAPSGAEREALGKLRG